MAKTVQDFLVTATATAESELVKAINRIPADKLEWSPEGKARTALDQFAECALLTGYTAELITTRVISPDVFRTFAQNKADVAALGVPKIAELLHTNVQALAAVIQSLPEEDLTVEVQLPGRPMSLETIIGLPYWNMSYHLGQINYIASMLGCLT